MHDLYDTLPGQAPAANDGKGGSHEGHHGGAPAASHWSAADGEGPDRLFNRYRRLRLQALAEQAA